MDLFFSFGESLAVFSILLLLQLNISEIERFRLDTSAFRRVPTILFWSALAYVAAAQFLFSGGGYPANQPFLVLLQFLAAFLALAGVVVLFTVKSKKARLTSSNYKVFFGSLNRFVAKAVPETLPQVADELENVLPKLLDPAAFPMSESRPDGLHDWRHQALVFLSDQEFCAHLVKRSPLTLLGLFDSLFSISHLGQEERTFVSTVMKAGIFQRGSVLYRETDATGFGRKLTFTRVMFGNSSVNDQCLRGLSSIDPFNEYDDGLAKVLQNVVEVATEALVADQSWDLRRLDRGVHDCYAIYNLLEKARWGISATVQRHNNGDESALRTLHEYCSVYLSPLDAVDRMEAKQGCVIWSSKNLGSINNVVGAERPWDDLAVTLAERFVELLMYLGMMKDSKALRQAAIHSWMFLFMRDSLFSQRVQYLVCARILQRVSTSFRRPIYQSLTTAVLTFAEGVLGGREVDVRGDWESLFYWQLNEIVVKELDNLVMTEPGRIKELLPAYVETRVIVESGNELEYECKFTNRYWEKDIIEVDFAAIAARQRWKKPGLGFFREAFD